MTFRRINESRISSSLGRFIHHCKAKHLFWIQFLLGCTALLIVVVLHTSLSSEMSAKRTARDNRVIGKMMSQRMRPRDKEILMDLVKRFIQLANELELVYFMSGGTLIGSWRHHGLITWDDDVDILVDETQKLRLLAAIQKMTPDYFGPDTDPIVKFYSKDSTKFEDKDYGWPFIDICFFRQDELEVWDTLKPFDEIKYDKRRIFPLHKRPFEQFELNSPRDPMHYFEKTYSGSVTRCQSHSYSHDRERGGKIVLSIHCAKLSHLVPFVHRSVVNGMVEETLKLGGKVIAVRLVEEDPSSLSGPYELVRARCFPWLF